MILEGRAKEMQTALFTVFFLHRRLISVLMIVFMEQWPFFQCTFLTAMSSIDVVYMVAFRPMHTKFDNGMDLFNEFCILIICHSMTLLLNVEYSAQLSDAIGWVMIGVVSLNIVSNLAVVVYRIVLAIMKTARKRLASKRVRIMLNKWESIDEIFDRNFYTLNDDETKVNLHVAIRFCRKWDPHRRWLIKMGINFTDFPEENKFQLYLARFDLVKQAKMQRLLRAVDSANFKIASEKLLN